MKIISNVVCPVCGSLCDDLEVKVEKGIVVDVNNACAVAEAKFLNYSEHRSQSPLIRKNGELVETTFDEAVRKSAEILVNSRYPVLYGWSSTSCEATRKGLELAEEVGGVVDNTSTVCHGPSIIGVQDIGISTCTLGQLRHRADLVIYWGSNPMSSHPRHIERYTTFTEGRFQPSGWKDYLRRLGATLTQRRIRRLLNLIPGREREEIETMLDKRQIPYSLRAEGRKMIVVDVRKTHTADLADYFIQPEANKDYELLQALRMLVLGEELEIDEVAGIPTKILEEIAEVLIECELGILFFGLGLTMSEGKHRNIDAALSLVRDLNHRTKFLIMPMRGHFNVSGADTVFTWQTGYPFAVDYSRGYPRYNPGETSIIDVLLKGEADGSLIIASDPVSHFPKGAVENLLKTPIITIDPEITPTALMSEVVFPSTYVGIENEGTAYRMDHVPLPLKKLVDPKKGSKSDVEIINSILFEVKRIKSEV
jgi:formylmethanofuran dehydrogenase subunit B